MSRFPSANAAMFSSTPENPLGFSHKDGIVTTREWTFAHVFKVTSGNLRVVKCRSPSNAHHLNAFMGLARTPPIGSELIGSFNEEHTFVKPNDRILPIIILLNGRTFPLTFIISIANEPFPTSKLNSGKPSNRIVAKGLVTIILVSRIIDNLIIVSFRLRELLVPGGRISNTILSDLNDLFDHGALHNSPIGGSISLQRTHTSAQRSGTSINDVFVMNLSRPRESKSWFNVGIVLKNLTGPLELLYHRFVHMHVRAIGVVAATRLSKLEAITDFFPTGGFRFGTRLSLGRRSPPPAGELALEAALEIGWTILATSAAGNFL